jgi:dTDP-4-dehydrorhamnose 3,5-epimerase-like enzyme
VIVRRPGGELVEVAVDLGRRNETFSEIKGGLSEGEEVVLLPRSFFNSFGFGP